jgi:ABC-type glycerol-3-phosphate transport system permease component
MAAATLSIIPVVVVFCVGQKQLFKGLLSGSVK